VIDPEKIADQPTADPPVCVRDNQNRFKAGRWATYTWVELYWWVKLLCKRADNRAEADKAQKDVADAQNYFAMAQAKLAHLTNAAKPSLDDLLDAETGAQHVAAMTAELEKAVTKLDRAARGEGQTP
jgi:hypothetical protein